MTIASDLLQRHIQTLVDDNAQWQRLIADDILWELAYAPSLGHPAQLSGREEAVRHATWFGRELSLLRLEYLCASVLTQKFAHKIWQQRTRSHQLSWSIRRAWGTG